LGDPKIKCFWWRVLKGFIPVREVLHNRHMEVHSTCLECGAKDEPIFHALTECTLARQFWEVFNDLCHIKLPNLHPLAWAHDILIKDICPSNEVTAILCRMWSVWTARNNQRHGNTPLNIVKACKAASGLSTPPLTCCCLQNLLLAPRQSRGLRDGFLLLLVF
jgi:hypothetical protein